MPLNTTFKTEKLHLRPFEETDIPKVKDYLNQYDFIGERGLPWGIPDLFPLSNKQIEQIITKWSETKSELHLAIILTETNEIIGHLGYEWDWDALCPGINIVISPPHQKKNYGSTVLQLVLSYAFNYTSAHAIQSWVPEWNSAGVNFFKKHYFVECGRMRRAGIYEGKYFDFRIFNILRREWKEFFKGGSF